MARRAGGQARRGTRTRYVSSSSSWFLSVLYLVFLLGAFYLVYFYLTNKNHENKAVWGSSTCVHFVPKEKQRENQGTPLKWPPGQIRVYP